MASPLVPIKFQVINYKSVRDSGVIWLSPDLTLLAGRNESGKSSLLEALRDFHPAEPEIEDDAVPIHLDGASPTIKVWFSITQEQLGLALKSSDTALPSVELELLVRNGIGLQYSLAGGYSFIGFSDGPSGTLSLSNIYDPNDLDLVLSAIGHASQIYNIPALGQEATPEDSDLPQKISAWLLSSRTFASTLTAPLAEQAISAIEAIEKQLLSRTESPEKRFLHAIQLKLPTFVYFSDVENLLPFETPILEAESSPALVDFASIAGLDLKHLASLSPGQSRSNYVHKKAAKISGDFKGHYSQDTLELVAETDGTVLRVGVKTDGDTTLYRAEQRSRGFQWFLSFFLRLTATCTENSLILIDEPGLYLHAKAQEDILSMLQRLCETRGCRIIFSTHSPYLVDTSRLDRVRLVDNSRALGTVVENKIHRNATSESLTPIITKMGLDVAKSFAPVGKKNVLLEGISDYYFICAFRNLFPELIPHASFIPSVGATKIPQLVSLLIGWGLDYVVVVDDDNEGVTCQKALKLLDVSDERIVRVPVKGGAIESVFASGELAQLVGDKDRKSLGDKVLVAKRFLELTLKEPTSLSLSSETKRRIESLMERIRSAIEGSEGDSVSGALVIEVPKKFPARAANK